MTKRKIVLAFSGGLDTSYALVDFREKGWEVVTANIDTGGLHSGEAEAVKARAEELGAVEHHVVDARAELYDRVVTYAIKANYLRNGAYPSCVGAERLIQAEKVVEVALRVGADAVAHGSTGAGADHVRYDAVIRALAPHLEIITPVRDERLVREEEAEFLRSRGFAVSEKVKKYSINEGLIGTSIGGEETYGSWEYLPEDAWTYTKSIDQAPETGVELHLTFDRGVVVDATVDGAPLVAADAPNYAILSELNVLGGAHGVGRGIHMGSTMVGNLARVGFEAPGMLILIAAHRELEKLVLSNRQQATKAQLGNTYGDLLHEAVYFDPIMDDFRAFLDSSQTRVTGTVRVKLHKGNIVLLGSSSPHSLLDAATRAGIVYGHGSSAWTGEQARAFAHMYAMPGSIARLAANPAP
ncbi:argininosuccinate synthase [Actinoplanes sp. SE50]|uniref:argininosuccinate synthase n=1 Tax=unclassified Actinoplanes TaxID=2626549 RepID=UPI00023ED301|nr:MULTISPECIES: argininosuccinate synthase [unclassified Actinoplanes]AEV87301.1 argininosuccinate synthase [Actinoplanes sp. SE50/110]ATO85701.1 argininosuccinate synthase [Actinoplanes sp. SE50]SLM03114.1 argininosuccinate synthase [Actinoplanes sp. SE50/110]